MKTQLFKSLVCFTSVGLVSACGMKTVKREEAKTPVAAQAVAAPAAPKEIVQTPAKPETFKGIAPEQALGWLKNGNLRYTKGSLRKDGQAKADVTRVSTTQNPHTIIVSCSDSRVPPELIFDQKLGEIFTVRTMGPTVNSNVVSTVEYAIEQLGARLIVVMGHTSCDAIKAATLSEAEQTNPMSRFASEIRPRLQHLLDRRPASAHGHEEALANNEGVIQDLMKRSAIIQNALSSGKVQTKSALYHMDSGKVEFH